MEKLRESTGKLYQMYHYALSTIKPDLKREEYQQSQEKLSQMTHQSLTYFAYTLETLTLEFANKLNRKFVELEDLEADLSLITTHLKIRHCMNTLEANKNLQITVDPIANWKPKMKKDILSPPPFGGSDRSFAQDRVFLSNSHSTISKSSFIQSKEKRTSLLLEQNSIDYGSFSPPPPTFPSNPPLAHFSSLPPPPSTTAAQTAPSFAPPPPPLTGMISSSSSISPSSASISAIGQQPQVIPQAGITFKPSTAPVPQGIPPLKKASSNLNIQTGQVASPKPVLQSASSSNTIKARAAAFNSAASPAVPSPAPIPGQQSGSNISKSKMVQKSGSVASISSLTQTNQTPPMSPPALNYKRPSYSGASSHNKPPPPPPPQQPQSPQIEEIHLIKAVYNYTAAADDELSFTAGEIMEVIEPDVGDGWLECKQLSTGKVGLVPITYCQDHM